MKPHVCYHRAVMTTQCGHSVILESQCYHTVFRQPTFTLCLDSQHVKVMWS